MITIRPSALPALQVSPKFESGRSSEAALLGQDRHIFLSEALKENQAGDALNSLVKSDEVAGVNWAKDYVLRICNAVDQLILSEHPVVVHCKNGKHLMQGTVDAICGDHIFDMKWRRSDYSAQMAAYALALMQMRNTEKAMVHLLFAESMESVCYEISKPEAEEIVYSIVTITRNPEIRCKASEYCKWCKHVVNCKVLLEKVETVEDHLAKITPLQNLSTPHGLGAALTLAHEIEVWIDEVFTIAKERALAGGEVTGYRLETRNAPRKLRKDCLPELHSLLGLSPGAFLQACTASIPKLEASFVEKNQKIHTKEFSLFLIKEMLSPLLEERKTISVLVKK